MDKHTKEVLVQPIFRNNPIALQVLGICSALAVTSKMAPTLVMCISVIITAAYYLWTIQRMFLGNLNPKYSHLPDLNWRERLTLYPLAALTLVFGFYPNIMLKLINTDLYAQLFSTHGTAMMFLFAVPVMTAVGI